MIGLHCFCPRISALPVRVAAIDGTNALVTEIGYKSEHEVRYDELNFEQKIDAIKHFDNTVNCLDHGFVRLVDAMPRLYSGIMDYAILEAARVSYDANSKPHTWEEDRGLIRYLIRHSHTTPFEMCLSGDTQIPTMPCPHATQKTYTLKELYLSFNTGGKENSWSKLVGIRTVKPDGTLIASKIRRIWKTGIKKVYQVVEKSALKRTIKATNNHPFLTPTGYKKLGELKPGDKIILNGKAVLDRVDLWNCGLTLKQIANQTGASNVTIYRHLKAQGIDTSRRKGFTRKTDGELLDPRVKVRDLLHNKLCSVCEAVDTHHKDKNIIKVCRPCHKALDGKSFQLKTYVGEIESITEVGEEEVYDLEVWNENHNFVAEGFVVHNCEFKFHCRMPLFVARQWIRHRTANVNEWSARYTPMLKQFYIPELEQVRAQSKSNKQGGEIPVSDDLAESFVSSLKDDSEKAYTLYEGYLSSRIANELSRLVLPVNYYTEWYWKIDLHNLLHFLKLRCDSHAQYETRVFADAMLKLITPHLPWTIEAWNDFNPYRDAITLTALEVEALKNGTNTLSPRATKREVAEWNSKLGKIQHNQSGSDQAAP